MGKYILLGMNQPNPSSSNLRIVHAGDDYQHLVEIWKTIENFHSQIEMDGIDAAARKMIEERPYLSSVYEVYFGSIIFTVTIVGIFEALKIGVSNMNETV